MAGRDAFIIVHFCKASCFTEYALLCVSDETIGDFHCHPTDSQLWMNLFEHAINVHVEFAWASIPHITLVAILFCFVICVGIRRIRITYVDVDVAGVCI